MDDQAIADMIRTGVEAVKRHTTEEQRDEICQTLKVIMDNVLVTCLAKGEMDEFAHLCLHFAMDFGVGYAIHEELQ